MNNETQQQIEKIKTRILKENKNNNSRRRRFSIRLRNDIAKLYINSSFTQKELAPLLGVGTSSIEKWTRKYRTKDTQMPFKEVVLVTEEENKKSKLIIALDAIRMNQIVLILVLTLLLTERLLAHLIS